MKKTIIALAGMLASSAAFAGTPVTASVPAAEPASLFGPGWVASPYAVYLTPDADLIDDCWGGGLGIEYYFTTYFGLGAQAQWADVDGDLGQTYAITATFRYPVTHNIAPYVQGAFGWQDLSSSGEIFGSAAAGLEVRFNEAWGIFGDWCYAFPGGGGGDDDFEDYQLVRAGFRVSF